MDRLSRKSHKKKKKKGWKRILITGMVVACLSLLAIVGVIGFQMYQMMDQTYEERSEEPSREGSKVEAKEPSSSDPFSLLLLGVDTEDVTRGRSDTIIVAIVDPDNEKISMLSIPRDTYTEIYGKNRKEKINHAYAYGLDTAIHTIEDFIGIPIDYYVAVNFEAFTSFIDLIGGLEIDSERPIQYVNTLGRLQIDIPEGPTVLDGQEALYYSRYRGDVDGDYGRIRRQQQVIQELLNQSLNLRTVSNINQIMDALGDNVRRDIPFTEMVSLASTMSSITGDNVETIPLRGRGEDIDGISYEMISEEDQTRIQQELRQRLNPDLHIGTDHLEDDLDEVEETGNDLKMSTATETGFQP